jgi:hypothetical protein
VKVIVGELRGFLLPKVCPGGHGNTIGVDYGVIRLLAGVGGMPFPGGDWTREYFNEYL